MSLKELNQGVGQASSFWGLQRRTFPRLFQLAEMPALEHSVSDPSRGGSFLVPISRSFSRTSPSKRTVPERRAVPRSCTGCSPADSVCPPHLWDLCTSHLQDTRISKINCILLSEKKKEVKLYFIVCYLLCIKGGLCVCFKKKQRQIKI